MEIKIDGIFNARDLGGMKTKDGLTIMPGRLIRSDNLSDLTTEGEEVLLKEYKLARIVDLRTENELMEQAPRKIEGADWIHLPLLKGDSAKRSNAQAEVNESEESELTLAQIFKISIAQMNYDVPSAITNMYKSLLDSDYSRGQVKRFFELLLENQEGSTLWHCTAGKDRTGFLTVLILELFGVDRKIIEEDFLLSGENLKPQTEGILAEIKKETEDPVLLGQVRILNSVLPEYTETVFNGIDERGGIEKYLTEQVGLTLSELHNLKDLYLMP